MSEWQDPVRLRVYLVKAAREGLSESEWAELAVAVPELVMAGGGGLAIDTLIVLTFDVLPSALTA